MLAAAAAMVTLAWGVDVLSWLDTGLRPENTAQGAALGAFLSWQSLFVATAVIMGLYALLRRAFGYLAPERPATVQLIGLFIAYSAAQSAAAALVVRLFPGA